MALSEIDRNLLSRCLAQKPRAWEDFVDRFMGLVVHVVDHSAQSRSIRLAAPDREDLVAEVFLAIIRDDMALLRRFRGESSLATYLTVVARRVAVSHLLRRGAPPVAASSAHALDNAEADGDAPAQRMSDRDEIARLLEELEGTEAQIVRMYHLEGKSYQEISRLVGIPENSVGPTLSRAREKMRRAGVEQ